MDPGGSEPESDDAYLDGLFGRIVAALSDGRDAGTVVALPSTRAHLADQVRELLETARRIATRQAPETPNVPGFEIGRLLGAGGMGKVYLATDRRLGRRVALKVLPSRTASGRARGRFEREARAVARLDHPLIVPIHGMGEDGGHLWFSMQYVEGRTLAQIASAARSAGTRPESLTGADFARLAGAAPDASAPLPQHWRRDWVAACVRAAADAADALAHAHSQGVVHRDVKPSNVMVRPDGFAVVFDFGLADVEDETTLTLTRGFLGTPHYASPEQAAGDAASLDARTDVWSLAAALYEILTLAPPFAGPTTHEVLRRIQAWDPEPASRTNPAVPADLDAVLRRALQKERDDRYGSASELAADLRAVFDGRPVAAPREGLISRGLRIVKRNRALTELLVEQRTRNAELRDLLSQAELARREAESARQEAEAARAAAERERDRARRTAGFFGGVLAAVDPHAGSKDVKLADIVEELARTALRDFADDPRTRAELLLPISRALTGLGRRPEGLHYAREAAAAARAEGAGDSRESIEADVIVATAAPQDIGACVATLERAHARSVAILGPGDVLAVRIRIEIGAHAGFMGDLDRSVRELRLAVAEAAAFGPAGHPERLLAEVHLGNALSRRPSTIDEGVAVLGASADEAARSLGREHPYAVRAEAAYGQVLAMRGDYGRAEAILRSALESMSRTHGAMNSPPASARMWLAWVLQRVGRAAETAPLLEEALRAYRQLGLAESPMSANCLRMLVKAYGVLGRHDDLRAAGDEAIRILELTPAGRAEADVVREDVRRLCEPAGGPGRPGDASRAGDAPGTK